MKTITVDLPLLREYFSEFYDFDRNLGLYFSRESYDIETDLSQKEFLEQYNQISNICRDYGLLEFTDIFFNLFFISWHVKILNNKISPKFGYIPDIEYKTQLYKLFRLSYLQLFTSDKYNRIENFDVNYCPAEAKTLRVDNKKLSEEMQWFAIDQVCQFIKSKSYIELSEIERGEVLKTVNQWFVTLQDIKKGGSPHKGYYLKKSASDMLSFIDNETSVHDQTKTVKCEFIGRLFEVYGLKTPTRQTGYAKMIMNILNTKD